MLWTCRDCGFTSTECSKMYDHGCQLDRRYEFCIQAFEEAKASIKHKRCRKHVETLIKKTVFLFGRGGIVHKPSVIQRQLKGEVA